MGVFDRSGKNDVMTHCANESVLSLSAVSICCLFKASNLKSILMFVLAKRQAML